MEPSFSILLTDRNRHVRELLRRELAADGYRVETAGDGRELLGFLYHVASIDLLILDLDLPFLAETAFFRKLGQLRPELPIIIHSFSAEESTPPAAALQIAASLEKSENTDRLKAIVHDVLARCYPDRS